MIQALIFDMDGVLFETEDFYYKRRADFLASKGISIAHLSPSFFVGGRASQVWKEILGDQFEQWDVSLLEKEYEDYKKQVKAPYGQRLYKEVPKVLKALKEGGKRLALASNTDRSEIERALREAGIEDYFDKVFSATECRACKPDPAVYEEAWASLGVPKEQTIIIEDSEKGIAAGVAAGIEVWAIKDQQYGADQSKASRLIDSLEILLEID